MTLSDVVFVVAGLVGLVGGVAGAYHALKSPSRRLASERGLRPEIERFCSAVVDWSVIAVPLCRIAFYSEFFVVRAPGTELTISYSNVFAAKVARRGSEAVVLEIIHPEVAALTLYLGNQNQQIVELIRSRSKAAL
jgi:hypothetical protein